MMVLLKLLKQTLVVEAVAELLHHQLLVLVVLVWLLFVIGFKQMSNTQ
jgi:hypothetical protein